MIWIAIILAGLMTFAARFSMIGLIGDRPIHIEIDGGVDPSTAPLVAKAGADVLVAGSAVFKGGSVSDPSPYGANIKAIREAASA